MPQIRKRRSRRGRVRPLNETPVLRRLVRPRAHIDRTRNWFVIWTLPRMEQKVQERLHEAGLAAYAPVETVEFVHRGRRVERHRLPVTRYVFVGLNAARPEWAELEKALSDSIAGGLYLWLRGAPEPILGRILRNGEGPLKIPACLLQAFADGLTLFEQEQAAMHRFSSGARVAVSQGPLRGFVGEVEHSTDQSVRALLDLFGRRTSVEFEPGYLEAA